MASYLFSLFGTSTGMEAQPERPQQSHEVNQAGNANANASYLQNTHGPAFHPPANVVNQAGHRNLNDCSLIAEHPGSKQVNQATGEKSCDPPRLQNNLAGTGNSTLSFESVTCGAGPASLGASSFVLEKMVVGEIGESSLISHQNSHPFYIGQVGSLFLTNCHPECPMSTMKQSEQPITRSEKNSMTVAFIHLRGTVFKKEFETNSGFSREGYKAVLAKMGIVGSEEMLIAFRRKWHNLTEKFVQNEKKKLDWKYRAEMLAVLPFDDEPQEGPGWPNDPPELLQTLPPSNVSVAEKRRMDTAEEDDCGQPDPQRELFQPLPSTESTPKKSKMDKEEDISPLSVLIRRMQDLVETNERVMKQFKNEFDELSRAILEYKS